MKKISIILAIAAAALMVSCEKEIDFGGKVGTPIRFGAATGYDNGPETRTEYSGRDESNRLVQSTSQYERIDWVANTDRISILCNEVAGSTKILDYKITSATASNEKSNAQVAPVGEQFNWGSGEHYFFAMYPAPTQDHVTAGEAVLNDNGNHTVTISGKIPATQEVTLSGREYKANMNYAYMYAAKKVDSPESDVELGFKPLVTAFEFTLLADNTFPITSNLTKVQLSASTELAGNFVATIGENGFTGNPTTSNVDQTLTLDLGTGIQLSKTDPVKFTFLALPKDQTGLKLMLTFASGETRSLELKNNSGFITVDACKKVYIRSVGVVPEFEYEFEVLGPHAGTNPVPPIATNGGSFPFKVTSYKKYGGIKQPIGWKVIAYSTNNGASWTTTTPEQWTTKHPAMLNTSTPSKDDTGSIEAKTYTGNATANTTVVNWTGETRIGDNDSKTKAFDLSYRDIYGKKYDNNIRKTANCYIVSAPGYYKFPLVYGNAISGTASQPERDNTGAYKTNNNKSHMLPSLVRHDGRPIEHPYLSDDGLTANKAFICWQDFGNGDGDAVISECSTDGNYIYFKVTDNTSKLRGGNAVLAAAINNTIIWSWHIWVIAAHDLYTVKVGDNQMLSVNLGWYNSSIPSRSVILRLQQNESEEIREFIVEQDAEGTFGGNVYYQWGRKDPMLGFTASFGDKANYGQKPWTHEDTKISWTEYDQRDGLLTWTYHKDVVKLNKIGTAIQNPNIFYTGAGTQDAPDGNYYEFPWWHQKYKTYNMASEDMYFFRWQDTRYDNLWNANADTAVDFGDRDHLDAAKFPDVVKTVYDPSPAGFKVPDGGAFDTLKTGYSWNGRTIWYPISGERRGLTFPCTSLREFNSSAVRKVADGADFTKYFYVQSAANTKDYGQNDRRISPVFFQLQGSLTPRTHTGVDTYGFSVRPVEE